MFAMRGSSNLGDFLNSLPTLSGIYHQYGKIDLVIQDSMERFIGIKELLKYQNIFSDVKFEREEQNLNDRIWFNSWIEADFDGVNPIETTRYEKFIKHHYNLNFSVDDSFILKFPKIGLYEDFSDVIVVGDRCSETTDDKSRSSNIFFNRSEFSGCTFLNFSNSLSYNCNVISNAKKFITTFTGVSVLVDLLGIEFDLYYEPSFDGWADQSIEYTYKKHFYQNRKSNLLKL